MLSDDFPLAEGTFVKKRDFLYEHYFKQDFKTHADFLHQAAICYAEVVNYHQRMNYAMGEKEYNDQIWFMAEWIREHKQWSIIHGLDKELIASEIGTAIFHGLYASGRLDTDNPEHVKNMWSSFSNYAKKYGKDIAGILLEVASAYAKSHGIIIPVTTIKNLLKL